MKPLARKDGLVLQETGDELLVYDLNTDKAICLNETSAFIWQNCDGNNGISEIRTAVEKKYGELVTEDFVKFAIDQLKKEGLIKNGDSLNISFDGMSRREVIKKVGAGSIIALPIIASLTAPPASFAASVCNTGAVCTCDTAMGTQGGACGDLNGNCVITTGPAVCACVRQGGGNTNGLCGVPTVP